MRYPILVCSLLLVISTPLAAQSTRPMVTIPNVTQDQVKNAFSAWCLTHEMDIAEAESNRVVCTKPIEGGRGAMIQMLRGDTAAPLIRLEISYASTGSAVIATGKQQLETQRRDGVVERTDFKQKDVIAGTQGILDDVAASLAPAPTPTETPAPAPESAPATTPTPPSSGS